MKYRIKQNAWGNWYGYKGTRKVESFSSSPYESQEEQALRWLDCMENGKEWKSELYKPEFTIKIKGYKHN